MFDSWPFFHPLLVLQITEWLMQGIFDIYTSKLFQWYKEHIKARCFDPYNWTLNFQKSYRTPKSPFWECECHPHTPSKWGCDIYTSTIESTKPINLLSFALKLSFLYCHAPSYSPFPLNDCSVLGHPLLVVDLFHIMHKYTKFPTQTHKSLWSNHCSY
jgi:hypothetical protein